MQKTQSWENRLFNEQIHQFDVWNFFSIFDASHQLGIGLNGFQFHLCQYRKRAELLFSIEPRTLLYYRLIWIKKKTLQN